MLKDQEVSPAVVPEKLAPKLAQPEKRIPAHGNGELLTGGVPGHKGAGGRPPNQYKIWLESKLNDNRSKGELTKVLHNNLHPAYASVLGKVMVHVIGVPGRAADADPGDGPSAVIIDL
jgi:hypothetical protein